MILIFTSILYWNGLCIKIPWLYQILATWKWNKNTNEAGVMSEADSGILDNITEDGF